MPQSLTPPDRAYYENKAKDSKIKSNASVEKKTTLGENISDVVEQERKEMEFQQNMFQYIDSVISMGIQHKSKRGWNDGQRSGRLIIERTP